MKSLFLSLAVFVVPSFGVNAQEESNQPDNAELENSTEVVAPHDTAISHQEKSETSLEFRNIHIKNPNAASRNRARYREADADTFEFNRPRQMMGPDYKNRRHQAQPNARPTRPARKQLIGPRYKNRRAKSGRG